MQFIINPLAGKFKRKGILKRILNCLNVFHRSAKIAFTEGRSHASELASRYVADGVRTIVSIGGDGTLNEIIHGIGGSNTSIGLVPMGSGNDFARSLGLYRHPFRIIKGLTDCGTRTVDIAKVDDQYFLNIMGTGIDAEVIKHLEGARTYFRGFYHALLDHKPGDYQIKIDGIVHDFWDVNGIFVANGKYFGRRMKISPNSILDDGLLEVIVIYGLSKARLFMLFPKIYVGAHITHAHNIKIFQAKNIEITASKEVPFQRDGELFSSKKVKIEILPGGVEFLSPKE
ncbi:diacylglycerol kinase family lipid kinase [Candidatus Calescamantes bacterium]|nr:diacylglycerol kinase family lipid kinase [Candidatus Calescamantes bacterium]